MAAEGAQTAINGAYVVVTRNMWTIGGELHASAVLAVGFSAPAGGQVVDSKSAVAHNLICLDSEHMADVAIVVELPAVCLETRTNFLVVPAVFFQGC